MKKQNYQKLISVLLAIMMIAGLAAYLPGRFIKTSATTTESGKCGDDLTWTLDGTTLTITGSGEMYDYSEFLNHGIYYSTAPWNSKVFTKVIFYNYGLTRLGDYAFYRCTGLTSIMIPDSVTSIGKSAFSGCKGLTNIKIPNSVTSIGVNAFRGCTGLTSILISDSVTSIGDSAFYGCDGLASITIPDSVRSIGSGAFCCDSLTSITVAKDNPVYHSAGNCLIETESKKLISGCKNSVIPTDGSVTSIGDEAFSGCDGLKSVTIPDSVTSIGNQAFVSCDGLKSVTIPDSVTSIGNSAFSWCSGLTRVTIGDGVTSISQQMFKGCTSLPSVTIPDGVTRIGKEAFYWCDRLKSVTIPDTVTSIGDKAFYYYDGESAEDHRLDLIMHVCNDSYAYQYAITNKFKYETNKIGYCGDNLKWSLDDSMLRINGEGDMWDFSELGGNVAPWGTDITSVKMPYGVTSIGDYAFQYCTGLTSVAIPDGVTRIGDYAFRYCADLANVTIPSSVTCIGDYAFIYCNGLTSITIPSSVVSIGDCAFHTLDWQSGDYKPMDIVLCVSKNSYAHQYAVDNGLKYEIIGSSTIKGDADDDGEITVADALAALRVAARLAEETPEMLDCCDTDGDGHITVADALAILRVAAKLAPSL